MLNSLRNWWKSKWNRYAAYILLIIILFRVFQFVAWMNSTTTITIIGG